MNAPNASELELLLNALRNQQQCDEDGVMCIVSREAVDKAISLLTAAKGEPVAITDEMVDEGAEAMKDVHSTSYHGQCPGIGWGEARACLEAALKVAPPRQRQGQAVAYLGTCIEDATDRKLRFGLPTSATTDLVDRFAYKWEPLYASPPNAGTPPEGWDAHDATILAGPSFLETDDAKRILAGPNAGTDAAREPVRVIATYPAIDDTNRYEEALFRYADRIEKGYPYLRNSTVDKFCKDIIDDMRSEAIRSIRNQQGSLAEALKEDAHRSLLREYWVVGSFLFTDKEHAANAYRMNPRAAKPFLVREVAPPIPFKARDLQWHEDASTDKGRQELCPQCHGDTEVLNPRYCDSAMANEPKFIDCPTCIGVAVVDAAAARDATPSDQARDAERDAT